MSEPLSSTEIAELFTEEEKLKNWMKVETVLAKVHEN